MCVHRTVLNCCTQYCTEQTWQFSPLPSRQSPLLRWCLFEGREKLHSELYRIISEAKSKTEKIGQTNHWVRSSRWNRREKRTPSCRAGRYSQKSACAASHTVNCKFLSGTEDIGTWMPTLCTPRNAYVNAWYNQHKPALLSLGQIVGTSHTHF